MVPRNTTTILTMLCFPCTFAGPFFFSFLLVVWFFFHFRFVFVKPWAVCGFFCPIEGFAGTHVCAFFVLRCINGATLLITIIRTLRILQKPTRIGSSIFTTQIWSWLLCSTVLICRGFLLYIASYLWGQIWSCGTQGVCVYILCCSLLLFFFAVVVVAALRVLCVPLFFHVFFYILIVFVSRFFLFLLFVFFPPPD